MTRELGSIVKRNARAHEVRRDQERRRRPEKIELSQERQSADLFPRNDFLIEREADQRYIGVLQPISTDDRDGRVRLRQGHHPLDTFREDPVVRLDHLAVAARRGDLPERDLVVLHGIDEDVVVMDSDPRVFRRIFLGDFPRGVRAAVVRDDVLEILVCLRENAFDALGERFGTVVDGSQDTDKGLTRGGRHGIPRSRRARSLAFCGTNRWKGVFRTARRSGVSMPS